MMVVYLIAGFIILTIGADILVRGSSALALKFGVPPLIIGLTIISFGTSAPELAVSAKASLSGNGAIALGNVIGSNIANIALILGLTALIRPLKVQVQVIRRDIPIMIGVSVFLWILLLDHTLQWWDGLLLFAGIIAYTVYNYVQGTKEKNPEAESEISEHAGGLSEKTWLCGILIVGGLIMLVAGGSLFVDGAVDLAKYFGVSDAIIGLTIVAIGTSMPELATSITAALKGESDMAIGNAVGSNIFNILAILGVGSLLGPISSEAFSLVDYGVMLVTALFLLPLAWSGLEIERWEGVALLTVYGSYLTYLIMIN
ncbi:MAG: calcium/sodium antiporter [SAR324 cluster bacterium]|nr:calcium/sodium antiporter [SAR324 cluster bacterium]